MKDMSHLSKLANVHTYLLTLRNIENLFFCSRSQKGGCTMAASPATLVGPFSGERKAFFLNENMLGKSLRSANCNNHLKSKAESPSLISSCNNRFQLEMYFFFGFKVQIVNRITCCSRAKPTLDRLNLNFQQLFLSGCPGPKYWRSVGV